MVAKQAYGAEDQQTVGKIDESGVTYTFEAEDEDKQGNASLTGGEDSGKGEDEAEEKVNSKNKPGLELAHRHEASSDKTHEGIETLTHGQEIGWKTSVRTRIFDEKT